ncbi:unnamed protein product, partial [Brenthis ino]
MSTNRAGNSGRRPRRRSQENRRRTRSSYDCSGTSSTDCSVERANWRHNKIRKKDADRNRKCLPHQKVLKLRIQLQQLLSKKMCSQRQALTILGRLNFANYVIRQGRLHCRNFQRHLRMLRKAYPRRKYVLPGEVRTDIYWWKHAVSKCSLIHLPQLTHHLVTDASNLGAMLNDTLLSGTWERNQQGWHGNLKELVAIQRTIEARAEDLKGASLLIQSDNLTALAYLRNEGGVKSDRLMKHTREANPPSSRVPIWDPQQVVSWLQNNVPQEVTYFEASRRCAVILLLVSGRRVHDLTLLRISPQHLEDNYTDMTLWPVFGSKTDTAEHQQSGWKLNVHEDQRICPLF